MLAALVMLVLMGIIGMAASSSSITEFRIAANELLYRIAFYAADGATEAGTVLTGSVRSSVGLAVLLAEGVGDTIRVSLAGPVEEEIRVGREILKSLGLRHGGVTVIACPTCGRCQIDVQAIAEEVERKTAHIRKSLVVAVMGCAVNGPGEAAAADVGIAGGKGKALLIKKGEIVKTAPEEELETMLLDEIEAMTGEKIDRD